MYEINFYEDESGYSEMKDYLEYLASSNQKNDKIQLKKILHQMNMLKLLGPKLNEPHAKFLKGYKYPIMELRPMPERIFYAAWNNNGFILLHHYTKKQNKTDLREINRALKKLEDWTLFKNSIQNISKDEIKLIDTLSYLQAERIRRGISQTELAKKIGMKQSQLAKIEQLDSTPTLTTLNRYAKGLGLAIQIKVIEYAEA